MKLHGSCLYQTMEWINLNTWLIMINRWKSNMWWDDFFKGLNMTIP